MSDEQQLDSALSTRIERLNIHGKQALAKALASISADSRNLKPSSTSVLPLFSSYSDSSCSQ